MNKWSRNQSIYTWKFLHTCVTISQSENCTHQLTSHDFYCLHYGCTIETTERKIARGIHFLRTPFMTNTLMNLKGFTVISLNCIKIRLSGVVVRMRENISERTRTKFALKSQRRVGFAWLDEAAVKNGLIFKTTA